MWFHLCRLNESIEANDIQIGVLNIDHVGCTEEPIPRTYYILGHLLIIVSRTSTEGTTHIPVSTMQCAPDTQHRLD